VVIQPGGLQVRPSGEEVTVKLVIALPLAAGAVQERVAILLPGVAVTPVGAPGTLLQTTVTMLEVACSELPLRCAMTALYVREVAVALVTVVTHVVPLVQ
jgi:hypothetical protein